MNDQTAIPNATIKQRMNVTVDCPFAQDGSFVLYLPTVNLRIQHNPAFSLACHLANKQNVPLVVLALVLDDAHLPNNSKQPNRPAVVFTARRIAFLLEALQPACRDWQAHGAGVAIRVHGPSTRTPHHLTLIQRGAAVGVVTDEPFVHPYLSLVQSIERVARSAQVPVCRVDGSTTVSPVSKLQRRVDPQTGIVSIHSGGVPKKAWIWQKQTDPQRRNQVNSVVREGHFDAPELQHKLVSGFFLHKETCMALGLPADWMDINTPCPGKRPWSAAELSSIEDAKSWVMEWPGIDVSVLPSRQTHGAAGRQRWDRFRRQHLSNYAKLRNNITKPHAVSRMSCYLNYGAVSIFQCVAELWQSSNANGSAKFADEIIKWREIGYVHAFGFPDHYNRAASVPQWARDYLHRCILPGGGHTSYSLEALESCNTQDSTWNAMQNYLNSTGELHNNARMTWGKTVVHWQKSDFSVDEMLNQLVFLNDRFALDGLSPPSYAGILWCFGWCDKPSNGAGAISEKPASRYRQGPTAFDEASRALLSTAAAPAPLIAVHSSSSQKRKRAEAAGEALSDLSTADSEAASKKSSDESKSASSILNYFSPQSQYKKTVG